MRRVLQRIVGTVARPPRSRGSRSRIADHRLDEAVELGLRFALGRLDHQRPGHREAHRRRVEAVVHQPLRDVVDRDLGRLLERPQVEDALVRDETARPRVQDRIGIGEALRDVVRGEDRALGRRLQAVAAHHRHVHPRDRQDARAAEGRRGDRADRRPRRPRARQVSMPRQERREVRADADRADARTAAAVRDAERLVQVEVRDVGAELARRREADERVQVRAVDVHLSAVRVDDLADLPDARLEHAVRRGVGDHDRGQVRARARPPSPRDRRDRRCRRGRRRRRRPACRPSARTRDSCRARTRGSGRRCGAPRRAARATP